MNMLNITNLYIYPVKSMKGIALKQARLTPKGLHNDRHWLVVDSNGRFVTQRDLPEMALIHTSLDDSGLILSKQGQGSVSIPLDLFEGERISTRVWKDDCETVDQGEEVSRWLTQALKGRESFRLVRMHPEFNRSLSKAAILGENTSSEFADSAPFLVANQASLDKLNSELATNSIQTVPMNRFRPNIVVEGLEPFAEHNIAELTSQNYQLKLRYPCERCIVTTTNQDTAEVSPDRQPFKTLRAINPMPGDRIRAPAFAENATLVHGDGMLACVGDQLKAVFR